MRTNEERVDAVRRRVARIKEQRRLRKKRMAVLSVSAASLALITGLAFAMPDILERLMAWDHAGYRTAASIFGESAAAGYIIIGLLAFGLGVCVTILCFRIRAFQDEEKEKEEKKDRKTEDGDDRVS